MSYCLLSHRSMLSGGSRRRNIFGENSEEQAFLPVLAWFVQQRKSGAGRAFPVGPSQAALKWAEFRRSPTLTAREGAAENNGTMGTLHPLPRTSRVAGGWAPDEARGAGARIASAGDQRETVSPL